MHGVEDGGLLVLCKNGLVRGIYRLEGMVLFKIDLTNRPFSSVAEADILHRAALYRYGYFHSLNAPPTFERDCTRQ